jgi:hypothetical protein
MTGQTNGLEPPVYIKHALSMSKQELDQYEVLVLRGGEVTANGLRARIEVAAFLGFVCIGPRMVAIGAIKRASAQHTRMISENSGFDLHSYRGELGLSLRRTRLPKATPLFKNYRRTARHVYRSRFFNDENR